MFRTALLSLFLVPLAFADVGARPGSATYTVTAEHGAEDVFFTLDPLPASARNVSVSVVLTLSEDMLIQHTPSPNGLGGIVWQTGDEHLDPVRCGLMIPNSGLASMIASADSSVGASWPLAQGGALLHVDTPGPETLATGATPWHKEVLAKVRFAQPWTMLTVQPTTASVTFDADLIATVTVTWE